MSSIIALFAALATTVTALPVQERQAPFEVTVQAPWNSGAVTEFQIHPSCNASQQLQLRAGLEEAVQLAQHAKDHILRWGNDSEIYQKYFGNRPSIEAIGSYDIIVNGDRTHALFRCDDPDLNCANNPTWAGHWRGNNATGETVICDPSFAIRRPLNTICGQGYNVREGATNTFWASDLLHRLYHVPAFGQEYIEHFTEDYDELIGNATLNSPDATHDSDGLQYFALEAYAYDIAVPGEGCPGPVVTTPTATTSAVAESSSAASVVSSATASATTTALPDNCHSHADGSVHCSDPTTSSVSSAPSATETASQDCHTHADGSLHCV